MALRLQLERLINLRFSPLIALEQAFRDFMLICIRHKRPSLVTRCQTYKCSRSARGSRHSTRDFLDEFVQFAADNVADRPKVESVLRPMPDVIALDAVPDRSGMPPGAQVLSDE
jgi:hypothetical protein